MARITGNMMRYKDPVSLFEPFNILSDFNNFTGCLVTKYKWCFVDAIPFHYVTTTDTTGQRF
jgi:hypothetical protein